MDNKDKIFEYYKNKKGFRVKKLEDGSIEIYSNFYILVKDYLKFFFYKLTHLFSITFPLIDKDFW